MTTKPLIYLTDRSATTTDWACGMSFWWNRKEAGKGIVPRVKSTHLLVGGNTHEDLALIAGLVDISPGSIQSEVDRLLSETPPELSIDAKEILYRRLGWLVAFALYVEPRLRAEYDTLDVEKELILDRNPLWVAFTPDRLLLHKKGLYRVYKEWKTTITAGSKWMGSWPFAIQLHIALKGLEEEYSEKIAFAQVMGLMKGSTGYGTEKGRLSHPYVWGWYNESTKDWTHEYAKARTAAWNPMPVWEYPGGMVEWVLRCGEDTALSIFPHSAPVFLNERLLDSFVSRRIVREAEIAKEEASCQASWEKRIQIFEQRFDKCRPPFGDPCPYLAACMNAGVNENPLASGLYDVRIPHHDVEITFSEDQ